MSSIEDRIVALVAKECGESADKIKSATSWKDLGFDSLQTVELIMAIEDEFGFEVGDDEAEKLQCYNDLVAYIEEKTK